MCVCIERVVTIFCVCVCVRVCIYVCIFPNESMKLGELYGDWYDLSVWLKERVRDSSD